MRFSYSSGSRPLSGYTIKRGIGVGGFGEVYFALNDAGKEVALKKIQRNLDIELRGVGYCLNLKHVNLISLWDIQTNEFGESWVVMEYVPGPSLRDVVEAYPDGMPLDEIKRWFVSTASGVAYLHEHGIVHRDLKPGNVFCDQDARVIKIGDYGLSKFISCSNRSGQTEAVGTFHYMAPEIGKGEYGKEIDIYAVGIILYEMLTGEVPFDGESTQEIIMKHLTMDPDISRLPQEYHRVIGKSLRKDPQKRYSSIAEMVRDLPWPEIAASANHIVDRHVVGTMDFLANAGTKPKSTAGFSPQVSQHYADAAEAADRLPAKPKAQLPPTILQGGFGADNQPRNNVDALDQPVANLAVSNLTANAPVAGELVNAEGNDADEPMALAVRSGLTDLNRWWNQANVSTPVRLGAIIVAGIVVIDNSTWLLAVLLGLTTVYLLYYAARRYLLSPTSYQASAASKAGRRSQLQKIRSKLVSRPAMDQLTELTGSLLTGAISTIVMSFFVLAIGLKTVNGQEPGPVGSLLGWSIFTWQTMLSVLTVWIILGISKQWSWKPTEFWTQAVSLVVTGAAVGALAFYTASTFEIDLARVAIADFSAKQTEALVYTGVAKLPAFVLCFAALFSLTLLGRYTDPLRRTRMSVMNVILSCIVGIIGSQLLNLPLTPVCSFAIVVSISIQLASPWLHPDQFPTVIGLPNDAVGLPTDAVEA